MYMHCHNCNWEQDDFWSEWYNPIKSLQFWEEPLLDMDLDKQWYDSGMTVREVISNELNKAITNIWKMKFKTKKEYDNSADKLCPVCGNNLDID